MLRKHPVVTVSLTFKLTLFYMLKILLKNLKKKALLVRDTPTCSVTNVTQRRICTQFAKQRPPSSLSAVLFAQSLYRGKYWPLAVFGRYISNPVVKSLRKHSADAPIIAQPGQVLLHRQRDYLLEDFQTRWSLWIIYCFLKIARFHLEPDHCSSCVKDSQELSVLWWKCH